MFLPPDTLPPIAIVLHSDMTALSRAERRACQTPRKTGGPTLFQASLGSIAPTGARRGQTVRFTLSGALLNDAFAVFFDDPEIAAKIATPPDKNPALLFVEATLSPKARLGLHRVFVQTPHGTTGSVPFLVGDWPEVEQKEPDDTPADAPLRSFPVTLYGALERPGDTDTVRFEAKSGEELVFEVVARPLRSRLQPVLTLRDSAGKILAESRALPGRPDAILGYRFMEKGTYTLHLRDFQNQGGGDVYYCLQAGAFPMTTRVFPLGLQKGTRTPIQVEGFNLGVPHMREALAPGEVVWGQTMGLPGEPRGGMRLGVGSDPEVRASAENDSLAKAQRVPPAITINGILHRPMHYYRFTAQKGERFWLEVQARRLGSRLDSQIEVLDGSGRPVERAILRAVGQTEVVLSDRDSASVGIRLQAWDDFRVNDFVQIGREVIQIFRLPAGPDEDVFFRSFRGQRTGFLGTTPEFHSVSEPVFKVEIHPPGRTFSPNGMPLTTLYYQNDDGGPLYGKDSVLEFIAPAAGDYIVRLGDTRGMSGADYPYRLMIHPPRPDFRVSLNPGHPNLPKGGSLPISVDCERFEGFDGPIALRLEGLPPGFTATQTVIEAGEMSAQLLLTAAPEAVTPFVNAPSSLRLIAEAQIKGKTVTRIVEPDNGARQITVLPMPDVTVSTDVREVAIRPGEEAVVEARIERLGHFGARVPISVQNLPFGVRILDIGLNGVLITEAESARKFTIYCEPWVKPQTRPFYVTANIEGGTANTALPLVLKVLPRRTAQAPSPRKTTAPCARRPRTKSPHLSTATVLRAGKPLREPPRKQGGEK